MAKQTFNPDHVIMLDAMTGTVPTAIGQAITQNVQERALITQLAKYVDMQGKPRVEFDVTLGGVGAYWVDEGEIIKTTAPSYAKVAMVAKKLATIVVTSREYLTYSQSEFFEAVKPDIVGAFANTFDEATILNIDNPFAWSLLGSAETADNLVEGDINNENYEALIEALNDNDYEPNAYISRTANKRALRELTRNDITGNARTIYEGNGLDDVPVFNVHRDVQFPKGTLIGGDFDYVYYGVPYNMTYDITKDATVSSIVDQDGKPLNLWERGLMAMRAEMDVAFMVVSDDAIGAIQAPTLP